MKISKKIKQTFPDLAVYKSGNRDSLFGGRNLPSFVKDYIVKRFSDRAGVVDREAVRDYLDTKMTNDGGQIRQRLLRGEKVNLTCRFVVQSDLKAGKTAFNIADIDLQGDAYILPSVIESHVDDLIDGENWGNISLEYVEPQGRKKGFVNMTSFRPFRPYSVDYDYFLKAREQFTVEEWMDVLIATMEYNPDSFIGENEEDTIMRKHEFLSRLLTAVEPRLNTIELGPKGTGKSYVYNNLSKYLLLVGNGGTTRARMFYNRATKQFGFMKTHDAVLIDEITTFDCKDDEVRSMTKGYLESGNATIDNVHFQSECGLGLIGNICLTDDMKPFGRDYYRYLPGMFRDSATLDRFHGFIQGWQMPRLGIGSIVDGWALNTEYISEIFHTMRFRSEYAGIFEDIVSYDLSSDLRDLKAVKKIATAYAKLLFPHILNVNNLTEEEKEQYKADYTKYCLTPAIKKRQIIREQCHLLDKEYTLDMPSFYVEGPDVTAFEKNLYEGPKAVSEKDSEPVEINESEMSESKIYVHSIFLSEGEFKEGEKEHRMLLIEEAERWIEQQAAEYGKKVEFVNGATGLEGETIHASTPKDIDCPDCTGTDGNYYLGLANEHFNIEELLYTMKEVGCDKAALLVIVDANGRSFSGWNGKSNEFMGTAVVYGDDGLELQSGVVAHELLHLFGADDLYAPMQNEEVVAFLREHYANEVMFQDHASADALTVSPYTAWRIGWTDEKEDWFDKIVAQAER